MPAAEQPLTNVRVLDVSGPIGAYATKLLADVGAEVVLVEPPGGDPLRRIPARPARGTGDRGLLFAYYHGGKRSVVLDAGDDASLTQLADLGAAADVVVLSPSSRARLAGFDPVTHALSWARDDAVVCAITPFGLTGPYRDRRATPFVSHAMSGDMHRAGPPDGPPVSIPARTAWDEAGAHAALCILAALLARDDAGGQLVDLSVHDVLCAKDCMIENHFVNGMAPGAREVRVGYPPTGTWQCADGRVDVAAHQVAHWDAFLDAIGRPEQLAAPALHDALVRRDVFDGLVEVIENLIARRSREELVERGQAAGLPCAPVNTPAQFLRDPQVDARDFLVTVHDDEQGRALRFPGRPVASSTSMFRSGRPAPELGGHHGFSEGGPLDRARTGNALDGVRVLSFGSFVAGHTAALPLAELGADVVKIEPFARPEVLRMPAYAFGRCVEEPSGVTNTVLHSGLSRSCRNLSLEMHTDEGRALFRRLVEVADVVIENFASPTRMARWGCSYEDLRTVNARLVMLSLSGYGRTGPRATYRAYASNISCFVGLTHEWGHTHGSLADHLCALHGVVGVLAGLVQVAQMGEGAYVDAAQIETTAAALAPLMIGAPADEGEARLEPNRVPGSVLSTVVRGAGDDAWLALELTDQADWSTLCTLLERPDLDADVAAIAVRPDELEAALAQWAAPRTPHTAALILQAAGLAAGAVQDLEDVARDPSLRARGMVVEVDHPDLGVIECAQSPYRLSVTPGRLRRPGPRLGEHTHEVLREWLDLDDRQVDALEACGAVFRAPPDRGAAR
jgi:crotonobetainyl-CoA:carnitine CoA-transferase CaiB-like acyl-CoA transferase